MNKINEEDDGTLAFLNIEPDKSSGYFNCKETTQQQLINTAFYIVDYVTGVKTKHGENRCVVKIKDDINDSESEAKKFFTNSKDVKYVLDKISEMNAFPRKATIK